MKPDSNAKSLFLSLIGLASESERNAYLDEQCGSNIGIRQELLELLRHDREGGSFLAKPAFEPDAFGPSQTLDETVIGEAPKIDVASHPMIGPYKLLEQIGEGGMGTVFHAQQSKPIRRKVALKIIKLGMDTGQVVARFEAERQALALMDHPNIAKVLDAGATEQGRPYFVMELVKGIPITDYCDREKLNTDQRLTLFIDVCHGVQHAHQKGIIHRDLKPSNILITLHDGKPVVKIIDFGIAKAIDQELTERTLVTQVSQMIGTPLYMSPEQAEVSGLDIDTRSDVYSLGVLLYELLTGTTPFDSETLKQAGFDEMRRIIREDEPVKPSERISTLAVASLSTISEQRKVDPRKLSHSIRGELDWIVMKALEKDRARRYESASAFAADVERYLSDEPVQACPPALGYRVQKYLKRHRTGLSWGLVGVVVLTGCGALLGYSSYREAARIDRVRERVELAMREVETAIAAGDLSLAQKPMTEATALVSQNQLSASGFAARVAELSADLQKRHKDQARYEELLASARDAQDRMTYSKELSGDIAAEGTLSPFGVLDQDNWLQNVESSSLSVAQKSRARDTIYETLLCLADHGPRWVRTGESARKSLEHLQRAEQFHTPTKAFYWVRSECYRVLQETDACDRELVQYNATPATIALDYYLPGHTAGWRGDRKAANHAYQEALRIQPDHFNSMYFLGDRLAVDKHFDEAIAYYTGCLALRPTHLYANLSRAEAYEMAGDKLTAERDFIAATELVEPVDHVIAFSKLLEFYGRTRQHEKHAESLARLRTEGHRLISEQTTNAGEDDPNTLELLRLLGETLCLAEAYSDGIPMLQQSLARHRIVFGSVHAKTLLPMNNLGLRLSDSNRAAEAVPLLEEALAVSTQLYGQDHNNTLILMGNLGNSYAKAGRAEQAVSLEEKALARFERKGETRHRLDTRHKLGFAYSQAQMWDKAVPFLRDTLALDVQELGPEHDQTLVTMWNLGVACDGRGQADMAVAFLEDAFEKHTRLLGENADRTLLVLNDLALALIHAGKAKQSLPLLARSVDVLRRQLGADHQETLIATFNLGVAYMGAEQFNDGVDLYEKLLETYTRSHGVEHPKTLEAGGALLEAYRLAGRPEEGKKLALSRLQILRTQSDEIQLSSGLAVAAEAFMESEMYADAEPLARECVEIRSVKLPDTWLYFNAQSLLGGTLIGQGKYEEAEPLLLQAFEGLNLHKDEVPPTAQRHIRATIDRLIQLYESTNRPDEVVRWKAKLPESQVEQPVAK